MQETINIEEGNKLIAEFMGAVYGRGYVFFPEHPVFKIGDEFVCYPNELFYHASWDWLMLVVEKIFTMKSTRTKEEHAPYLVTFGMHHDEGNFMVMFLGERSSQATTLIEATWLAVLDFIKMNKNAENET